MMVPLRWALSCNLPLNSSWRRISPLQPSLFQPTRTAFKSRTYASAIAVDSIDNPETIREAQSDGDCAPPRVPAQNVPMQLRPYQEEAISACLDAFSSGLRRIGVSSPTGSGKTTMFMSLIPRLILDATKNGGKGQTMIIVNSVELAEQAEKAAKSVLGKEWTVEVEQAKRTATGYADVTISTYHTLNIAERLQKFDPSRFKLVIVDEAHHAASKSYLRTLHYFNQDIVLPSSIEPRSTYEHGHQVPIIGFSATFSRTDQLALSAVFQEIVFHREISDMLGDGYLAPAKSTTVKALLQLDQVEVNQAGDFKTNSLVQKINTPDVNELVVRTYMHLASERRSTLVFCVNLQHVDNLTQTFRSAGIDARSVSSQSKADIRRMTIEEFKNGQFPVLVNCEVLTEGADIPQIDCVLLARPTKSRNLLAQMIGRGLRLSHETGKSNCHIIDVVDSVSRVNGIAVVPTLLGLSHEEMQRDEEVQRGEGKDREANGTTSWPGSGSAPHTDQGNMEDYEITYLDEDDPFGVGTTARPIVEKASPNAWVSCGKNKHILELLGNGQVVISVEEPPVYDISHRALLPPELAVPGKKRSFFARARVVGQAPDLERALQAGDLFAEKLMGRENSVVLRRHAPWRQKPASEKAIKYFLKTLGLESESILNEDGSSKVVDVLGKKIHVGDMTAGEVSSWLCAAKNGAKTQKKKAIEVEEKKKAREAAKFEKERLLSERNLPLPRSA